MKENARIHIPLLEGEYNPLWKIRSRAQIFFLDIVGRVTPAPLYSLRDEILPKYRAAFEIERKRGRPSVEVAKLSADAVVDLLHTGALTSVKVPIGVRKAMKAHPRLYDAGAALIDWSKQFNLKGKAYGLDLSGGTNSPESILQHRFWPIVVALQTILFWQFHPVGWIWERRNPPSWCPPVFTLHEPLPEPEILPPVELFATVQTPDGKRSREIGVPGWYVGLETKPQFRERIGEAFNHWLENHIAAREKSARAAGLETTPGKRKLELHFTWAAKYQIGGVSPANPSRQYQVVKDTIEEGIQAALDLIHLDRRSPKRGGLKGSKH